MKSADKNFRPTSIFCFTLLHRRQLWIRNGSGPNPFCTHFPVHLLDRLNTLSLWQCQGLLAESCKHEETPLRAIKRSTQLCVRACPLQSVDEY